MKNKNSRIGFDQWLGVVGGGQLGRMFCQSAQAMGFKVLVLEPDVHAPACQLADDVINQPYDNADALDAMAQRCVAVTTEFENVSAQSFERLARHTRVAPAANALDTVQDRATEKAYIRSLGIPVAPYAVIESLDDLSKAAPELLADGILKLSRMGYDGKGQHRIQDLAQARQAFSEMGERPCVLESRLPLDHEISIVLARGLDSQIAVFDAARNVHHDGILAVTHVDGQQNEQTHQARDWACQIAQQMNYHGVLCVEFFVLQDGSMVVNEIAPRPHNSGHFTQNACVTNQFEQQARVMAGLPLGDPRLLAAAVMLNLLGEVWVGESGDQNQEPDWSKILALPGVALHLYGKTEARVGRKMGHVNITAPDFKEAVRIANVVVETLSLPEKAVLV